MLKVFYFSMKEFYICTHDCGIINAKHSLYDLGRTVCKSDGDRHAGRYAMYC